MKMSKKISESKVMTKVSTVVTFIKEQLKKDIIEAKNEKLIDVELDQLTKILNISESSIQANFVKSSNEITSLFK